MRGRSWRVLIEWGAVERWRGYILVWLAFVLVMAVVRHDLNPRADEVLTLLVLPLFVVPIIAVAMFIISVIKVSLAAFTCKWRGLSADQVSVLDPKQRIGSGPGGRNDGSAVPLPGRSPRILHTRDGP
jgi:hypothetical protein